MGLKEKVKKILTDSFPDADKVVLDDVDGVSGYVTSRRFKGLEMIDRINMIWDVLDAKLTKEERKDVFSIVPVTPEEEIAHST
jgi:stress-induced morphogen